MYILCLIKNLWKKDKVMKDRVIVLGSSGGAPTKRRNCTSFILAKETYGIMFDCGEGTQRQMIHAGYKLSRLKYIFISHMHFDHIGGLIPMLSTKSMFGIDNRITILGPPGIKAFIDFNLAAANSGFSFEYEVEEIGDGKIYELEGFKVEICLLNHRLTSYGFRIKFDDTPGNIIPEKLAEFGLSEGPVCGRLKKGESVTLENGRVITLDDVGTGKKEGMTIAFLGDTYLCKGMYKCMDKADLAIAESTFLEEEGDRAVKRTHLTAKMTGNVAERSGVKELLLYHFSASYPFVEDFRKECSEKFSGKIYLAHDLKIIEI